MAVGKNKGLKKGGKTGKGGKKKVIDSYARKDWYDVKAPNMFQTRNIGKTLVNRTVGQKIASDSLKGRVFEVSLPDLQRDVDPERSYRKFRLIAEDVQDRNVLCNFHGIDLTTDKYRSMVKKWQTLIEAAVEAKTVDGYLLRIFCIGFTAKDQASSKKTCYAQQSQVRRIRARMSSIITREVSGSNIRELVNKFALDSIAKDIEKHCHKIYPLHDTFIRKVKVLRKPRFDLVELHGDSTATTTSGGGGGAAAEVIPPEGVVIDRPEYYEPPVLDSV